jgi:hypothetical protein
LNCDTPKIFLKIGDEVANRRGALNLETAVEEGFRARKWPSHPGKEALLGEF